MNPTGFAIFCFFGFLVPVPILSWLNRPKVSRPKEEASRDERPPGLPGAL